MTRQSFLSTTPREPAWLSQAWRRRESNPRPRLIDSNGLVEPNPDSWASTPCEFWEGCLNSKGYGVCTIHGRRHLAHRAAFFAAGGALAPGEQIHHLCGERRCVNPAHLEPVTARVHNRLHVENPIAEGVLAMLADGRPKRYRDLRAVAPGSNIGPTLARCVAAGEIRRVGRGVYVIANGEAP